MFMCRIMIMLTILMSLVGTKLIRAKWRAKAVKNILYPFDISSIEKTQVFFIKESSLY